MMWFTDVLIAKFADDTKLAQTIGNDDDGRRFQADVDSMLVVRSPSAWGQRKRFGDKRTSGLENKTTAAIERSTRESFLWATKWGRSSRTSHLLKQVQG